jgi:hypothetical protein
MTVDASVVVDERLVSIESPRFQCLVTEYHRCSIQTLQGELGYIVPGTLVRIKQVTIEVAINCVLFIGCSLLGVRAQIADRPQCRG